MVTESVLRDFIEPYSEYGLSYETKNSRILGKHYIIMYEGNEVATIYPAESYLVRDSRGVITVDGKSVDIIAEMRHHLKLFVDRDIIDEYIPLEVQSKFNHDSYNISQNQILLEGGFKADEDPTEWVYMKYEIKLTPKTIKFISSSIVVAISRSKELKDATIELVKALELKGFTVDGGGQYDINHEVKIYDWMIWETL